MTPAGVEIRGGRKEAIKEGFRRKRNRRRGRERDRRKEIFEGERLGREQKEVILVEERVGGGGS